MYKLVIIYNNNMYICIIICIYLCIIYYICCMRLWRAVHHYCHKTLHIGYEKNRVLSFCPTCFRSKFFVQSFSSNPIRLGYVSLGQVMLGLDEMDWTKTDWTKSGWTKMNWTKSRSTYYYISRTYLIDMLSVLFNKGRLNSRDLHYLIQ